MKRSIRSLARALRHTPDRVLHRWRRREAIRLLRERGLPRSVLFVCHGNICRSPYAAAACVAALQEVRRPEVEVFSAGFIGPGRPSPPAAVRIAAERGLDLSDHRSETLTPARVTQAEFVVVMDARQRRAVCRLFGLDPSNVIILGDLDPEPIDTRAIRDPINQPDAVFEASYDRIDRCIRQLVEAQTSVSRNVIPLARLRAEEIL